MSGESLDQRFSQASPNADDAKPLYLQLEQNLRQLISSGQLINGDALPAERDLALITGVSRVTVRKALDKLVKAGLLVQRPGAGTFVADRIEQPLSFVTGFSEDMRARGRKPGSVWLEKAIGAANPDEAMALGLVLRSPVIRLSRIRTADGEPMAIETAVISCQDVPSPNLVNDSFYAVLKERDLLPVRALQRIHAQLADAREAKLLGLERPCAILKMERRSFLADGRPLEVTFSSYRADVYDFVVELWPPGRRG